jgi:arylformamidase
MAPLRIVELSHRIIPGKEHFQLEARIDDVTSVLPEVKHRSDVWYVLGAVTYCTHVGTHIEVPFHHLKEGDDVADFPFRRLIGRLVVLDFRHKKDQEAITLEEIKVHDGRIRAGDIVFIRTGMDELYRTERWNEQPHLTVEANGWLVEKRIACLGSDAAGLELPGTDYQPNHQAIFRAGIPMIESATNLGQIQNDQYLVFILPLPIEGLEASPLRIIAIPKEDLHAVE